MVDIKGMDEGIAAARSAAVAVTRAGMLQKAQAADIALNVILNLLQTMADNIEELAREVDRMQRNGLQ